MSLPRCPEKAAIEQILFCIVMKLNLSVSLIAVLKLCGSVGHSDIFPASLHSSTAMINCLPVTNGKNCSVLNFVPYYNSAQ